MEQRIPIGTSSTHKHNSSWSVTITIPHCLFSHVLEHEPGLPLGAAVEWNDSEPCTVYSTSLMYHSNYNIWLWSELSTCPSLTHRQEGHNHAGVHRRSQSQYVREGQFRLYGLYWETTRPRPGLKLFQIGQFISLPHMFFTPVCLSHAREVSCLRLWVPPCCMTLTVCTEMVTSVHWFGSAYELRTSSILR